MSIEYKDDVIKERNRLQRKVLKLKVCNAALQAQEVEHQRIVKQLNQQLRQLRRAVATMIPPSQREIEQRLCIQELTDRNNKLHVENEKLKARVIQKFHKSGVVHGTIPDPRMVQRALVEHAATR